MIRWFRNWRTRRRQRMCARIARLWAECEAELLAEIEAAKALNDPRWSVIEEHLSGTWDERAEKLRPSWMTMTGGEWEADE